MKSRRIIAAVMAISSLMCQLVLLGAAVNAADEVKPLLWYDFEDGAKDASDNGLDGTVNGAVIKDGTAVFDGTDDYIKMPDGILKDAASATIAINLKTDIEKKINLPGA